MASTKSNRRRLIFGCVVFLISFGYFLLWITGPGPGINRQGFAKITMAMSEEEVIVTLQAAPGDYITGKPRIEVFTSRLSEFPQRFEIEDFRRNREIERENGINGIKEWLGDEAVIIVRFDANGRVAEKVYHRVIPDKEPFVAMLRRWFRL